MSRDDEYDAFGRPIERREGEDEQAEATSPAPAPGGFLPPTEQPPEREAWWADPAPPAPSGSSATSGWAPPSDSATTGWAPPSGSAPAPTGGFGPATAPGGQPAEWLERVGAAVVDGLIRLAIGLLLIVIVALAAGGDEDATTIAVLVAMWTILPFYAPILMARWDGQTVGHKATGTRIVNSDGSRISGGRAVVREVLVKHLLFDLVGGLLTIGIAGLLNYLWPLWDDKNEALHDKICKTRVVKT